MSDLVFRRLNEGWNAEPNAPDLRIDVSGATLTLTFRLNPWAYEAGEDEIGALTFTDCRRWRRDETNDHAWFAGKGRYGRVAPAWGEFYELTGPDPARDAVDWRIVADDDPGMRHFLFYFRDEAVECLARDWTFDRRRPSGQPAAAPRPRGWRSRWATLAHRLFAGAKTSPAVDPRILKRCPADIDAAIVFLHAEGLSIIDSIRLLSDRHGLGLATPRRGSAPTRSGRMSSRPPTARSMTI